MPNLKSRPEIHRLAKDLGLPSSADPASAIRASCRARLRALARQSACKTPSDLLAVAQNSLRTVFREIRSDEDLTDLRSEYVARNELGFAQIVHELASPDVYAITLKLNAPRTAKGEHSYVSVIDCRGAKAWRANYSKWHELAHLLTLTSQTRIAFRRTHGEVVNDPEEQLMEVIAGDGAFLPELVVPHIHEPISFDAISRLRQQICPEASEVASHIGFVKAWPVPCLSLRVEMGLKKVEERARAQRALPFHDPPKPVLRAVKVTVNPAAQRAGFSIPRNMRVPERSVISRAFHEGQYLEAEENLSWGSSSKGGPLGDQPIRVSARRMWDHVQVLITAAVETAAPGPGR
jgi:hypothetical protein